MIDTDKYEGHTKGNNEVGWRVNNNFVSNGECPNDIHIAYVRPTGRVVLYPKQDVYEVIEFSDADAQLIADAPLLLAEVKRLRKALLLIADTANGRPFISGHIDSFVGEVLKELKA